MAAEEDAAAEATAAEEVAEEVAEEESTTGINTVVVAVDGEDEAMVSLVAATEAMRAGTRPTSPSAVAVAAAAVAPSSHKRLMPMHPVSAEITVGPILRW